MFPAFCPRWCHVPMDKSPAPTTTEQQHSSLQTPKAGKLHPSEQGITRGFNPTSSPWKSRPAPMQAGTSRRSAAGSGSLHSSSRSPSPGALPLCPSSPAPRSPHLSQKKLSICGGCRGDGWLGGEASGHLRARASRPGWRGALGRGQRSPPPASLNTATLNFS